MRFARAYEEVAIEGAQVAFADLGERVLDQWKSQQLTVIVDGRETLTALLDTEMTEVYQGLWTNSRYLSCLMHSGRLAEHTLVRLHNAATVKSSKGGLLSNLASHPFLLNSDVPGHREMLVRYAGKSKPKNST